VNRAPWILGPGLRQNFLAVGLEHLGLALHFVHGIATLAATLCGLAMSRSSSKLQLRYRLLRAALVLTASESTKHALLFTGDEVTCGTNRKKPPE